MSNKIAPVFVALVMAMMAVGGWWYIMTLAKPEAILEPIATTTVSAKALRDSADKASAAIASLKVFGKVPLDANGLDRNPIPLFRAPQ